MAGLDDDRLLTDLELQGFLGVSRTTLWRLRNIGGLPFGKVGREYRYRKQEILEWMKDKGFKDLQLALQLRRTDVADASRNAENEQQKKI